MSETPLKNLYIIQKIVFSKLLFNSESRKFLSNDKGIWNTLYKAPLSSYKVEYS